ncbi:response regulator transcription factor [Acidicapsa acidisoli]|uniref:response regulator transcription factor n=1 Tax=Acidicapsa acidisoli TaxID=1615681 RepID=UPI0021E08B53|nr:LuxR C-terminal-related transcriptional regulator [Acidicapsa acidisoli]
MTSGGTKTIETYGDVGLKACLNDLIGILALPAIWAGQEQDHVIKTLTDAICRIFELDFVYAGVNLPDGKRIERIRVTGWRNTIESDDGLRQVLGQWLRKDPKTRSSVLSSRHGDGQFALAAFPFGSDGRKGVFVAGSDRSDFPSKSERLLLNIAANQAAIGLREAQLLSERTIAQELNSERTQQKEELAIAKDELRKENEQRKAAERALRVIEARLSREVQMALVAEEANKSQLAELQENCSKLTRREREVLPFVVAGRLSKQIAGDLGTSEITIRVHRGQIMRKMQAHSLADLIRMADRLGIQ